MFAIVHDDGDCSDAATTVASPGSECIYTKVRTHHLLSITGVVLGAGFGLFAAASVGGTVKHEPPS